MTETTAGVQPMEENTSKNIVEIKNLVVHYETADGIVEAVNNVSLNIERGKTLGLVGETGAGKTTIALALMKLLPFPPANVIQGEIYLDGEDLMEKNNSEMRQVRSAKVSMIFQDPMTALNPVMPVGDQIAEVIRIHEKTTKAEAMIKASQMLEIVGIQKERYKNYPHELSGGMKQRVVIAMALVCNPELIIADEPTTALDVTIQAQVLQLMKDLRDRLNTSMLMITHDFGIVVEICDDCAVIYAGEIVESGSVQQIFENPMHPYTIGLFESLPKPHEDVDRLKPIRGMMANPMDLPPYCSFYDRCDFACDECKKLDPVLVEVEPGHKVKCLRYKKMEVAE